ncbi:hypothetical protein O1V64_15410 [Rouxiella badensis]|nr:hypothetical protein O1V64_15410 [Rouxiella badensis]
MSALFRKEVATQQQTQWLGKALLLKGWPLWITVSLTSLFMVLLLLFLIFANYTRRINVSAEVITQPYTINLFLPSRALFRSCWLKTVNV